MPQKLMSQNLSITDINQIPNQQFVEALGSIFEHSSWVAQAAVDLRPFESVDQLHTAMVDIVDQSSPEQRMTLIRNHPELAGKEASAGTLTTDSLKEQAGAGLDQCSAEELSQLRALNQTYQEKFKFPFIIAVTGLNRQNIIDALALRVKNTSEVEFKTSLAEIAKIGKIRLDAFFGLHSI
jgi:2-oxo-4-hydroxy-4-carboxy-5-ureidoimidazoline decarboxylase